MRVKWDDWDEPRIWTLDDSGKPYTRESAERELPQWHPDAHATIVQRIVTITEWAEDWTEPVEASRGADK